MNETETHRCRGCRSTRRAVLSGVATAGTLALAGCLGDDEDDERPDPVALDGTKQCAVCGMLIEDSFGPNGQTYFEDDSDDQPAWYDSVREQLTDRVARPDDALETYVTDYSRVEYDLERIDGTEYITGDVTAESFTRAADVTFVVESGVEGAMGTDLLPFGDPSDATAFVEAHGGEMVDSDDITQGLLEALSSG